MKNLIFLTTTLMLVLASFMAEAADQVSAVDVDNSASDPPFFEVDDDDDDDFDGAVIDPSSQEDSGNNSEEFENLEKRGVPTGGFILRMGGTGYGLKKHNAETDQNKPVIKVPKKFWLEAMRTGKRKKRDAERNKRGVPISMGGAKQQNLQDAGPSVKLSNRQWLLALRSGGLNRLLQDSKRERRSAGGWLSGSSSNNVRSFALPKNMWKWLARTSLDSPSGNSDSATAARSRTKRGYPTLIYHPPVSVENNRENAMKYLLGPDYNANRPVVLSREIWGNLFRSRKRQPTSSYVML